MSNMAEYQQFVLLTALDEAGRPLGVLELIEEMHKVNARIFGDAAPFVRSPLPLSEVLGELVEDRMLEIDGEYAINKIGLASLGDMKSRILVAA